ncbi:acyl-CoA dehydrogenase family protein [Phytohabitans sp. ZYX-F-186]|uniref:Acyl-CoA dehydrogenase family protein n=1 Tax=Phytohabitans maris TaxID=3071409 RepID=A0ABU0Z9L7_9ACTN|nr:acyl-CoA dehydrogenase family protein [Phytohabitans sp. ZYX-F-186]MDQ7903739.1 acyl-CoA dehydrogenase family protein [Phytohabitans sp. ZYX-F-186]
MDIAYTAEEDAFRAEVRAWLGEVLPALPPAPPPHDWPARRVFDTTWQRTLYDAGYGGLDWPAEYGGRGASPVQQLILLEETERARAPYGVANYVGLKHAGPTIAAEGTPAQKERHLGPILRGDEVWCQGFSEPGAGSDLASLRTRAVRDGDDYVLTGQKIWTSHSLVADFCEILVRTDPDAPKHKGLTWLIMPMDAPGVRLRPLRTIMGSTDFAEMFLDGVRVPVANRVGAENDGWRVAMVTLSFERGTAFTGELVNSMVLVEELARLARKLTRRSGTAWNDAGLRREIGHLAAGYDALWALTLRNVSEAAAGSVPGVGATVFKLRLTELRTTLLELFARLLGRAGLTMSDLDDLGNGYYVEERLRALSLTIAGGTSNIQRNIIAERLLGLPK